MEPREPTSSKTAFDLLPDSAFIREAQLVHRTSRPSDGVAPIPFGATTLWRKVRAGEFPKPVKLSERVTAWRVGDVRAWLRERAEAAPRA